MEMIDVFINEIEKIKNNKGTNYIDSVVMFCEQNGYEVESVALLIKKDPVLTAKIKNEAEISNLLKSKRGSRLPI
jgi:Phage late-transcription coactivator